MSGFFETRVGMCITALCLFIMAIGGLAWFVVHSMQLVVWIVEHNDVVNFDKGTMYLLGSGIAIICLVVMRVDVFIGKRLSESIEKRVVKVLLTSVIMMFTLPHIVHAGIYTTLISRDYIVCEELTTRWLMHVSFVYADSADKCIEQLTLRELRRGY